jgi:hypothetical protein
MQLPCYQPAFNRQLDCHGMYGDELPLHLLARAWWMLILCLLASPPVPLLPSI